MNKKKYMWVLLIIPVILFIILSFAISNEEDDDLLNYTIYLNGEDMVYQIDGKRYIESEKETNLVKIDVKDYGIMIAELYPKIAPISVKNFKKLISEKYYDNLIFHRVVKDFVIQTGDPTGTGSGGSEKTIKGEFALNGVKNDLSHERGVLSMARMGGNPETEDTMNSASSQFFIVHEDHEDLDGRYAAFGKLIHGYDVLDKVASVSVDSYDKPLKNQIINSIRFVDVYKTIEVDY